MSYYRTGKSRTYNQQNAADAIRMAEKRAAGRDLQIPKIANPRRRARAEMHDDVIFVSHWLRIYLPTWFTREFSYNQKRIIEDFLRIIKTGGKQASAAPRGEGKSTIAMGMTIWAAVTGRRNVIMLICASGNVAAGRLRQLKLAFETSQSLVEDYPEICSPIIALKGATQRANTQTVNGMPTKLRWTDDEIAFAHVAQSKVSGTTIKTVGIDGKIRGFTDAQNRRPDLALLDDLETEDSVKSQTQTEKIKTKIDKAVVGLGEQQNPIAIMYICTILLKGCAADQYTDPQTYPAWNGQRLPAIYIMPKHREMWDKYIDMRRRDQIAGDKDARNAHNYYLSNRQKMDWGAKLGNEQKFSSHILQDGSQQEASALQACFNFIADARNGWHDFNTEFQGAPPEISSDYQLELATDSVLNSANGRSRGLINDNTKLITAAIDVGGRALHYSVFDWDKNACGKIIDYGTQRVLSPIDGALTSAENLADTETAIYNALNQLREKFDLGYPDETTGELRPVDVTLIDGGWMEQVVCKFVRTALKADTLSNRLFSSHRWRVSFGRSAGNYKRPTNKNSRDYKIGDNWYAHYDKGKSSSAKIWKHSLDTDYYKQRVFEGFKLPKTKPTSLQLFGQPIDHRKFANHMSAERYVEKYVNGNLKRVWEKIENSNHYFDTAYMNVGAAEIAGMVIAPLEREQSTSKSKQKKPAAIKVASPQIPNRSKQQTRRKRRANVSSR